MEDFLGKKILNKEWFKVLKDEFKKDYFKNIEVFLKKESKEKTIFPNFKNCFLAFNKTPLSKVKVVILGQDPYHRKGQANGLSFSVPKGFCIPPSLRNIFKELSTTFPKEKFLTGDLSSWAEQGVFLLNSVLTVEESKAASHRNKGWESFTDCVLKILNEQERPIVFMLWGAYAYKKALFLSNKRHLILCASHPSPLSAYRGFLGCQHFKMTHAFLKKNSLKPIKWGF